jgi:DNA-directed RNA polymerase subunit RPC12/RpoP
MNTKTAQIACPNCRSTVVLSVNGNAVITPLVCKTCGQAFLPHFYCPDANSTARHIFAASELYVDNAGKVYTFCPEHTFTSYLLAADSRPRPRHTPLYRLARFFNSLAFRALLTIEGWRWRLASRHE